MVVIVVVVIVVVVIVVVVIVVVVLGCSKCTLATPKKFFSLLQKKNGLSPLWAY